MAVVLPGNWRSPALSSKSLSNSRPQVKQERKPRNEPRRSHGLHSRAPVQKCQSPERADHHIADQGHALEMRIVHDQTCYGNEGHDERGRGQWQCEQETSDKQEAHFHARKCRGQAARWQRTMRFVQPVFRDAAQVIVYIPSPHNQRGGQRGENPGVA